MKFQLHVSPEMFRAIKDDAAMMKLTHSQVVRNKLAAIYGVPSTTPRNLSRAPDPLLVHDEIPKGANI